MNLVGVVIKIFDLVDTDSDYLVIYGDEPNE